MNDYCEYSHDLPPIWTQLTVKLSHKEKPCPVINLDDSYPSVFLHSQFGMREKIRPQQLVGLLYPFIARFVGSSQQFQPDEQRLLFGPLRRHNEIVREQDRLRIFAPKSQFLLLDLIGMRRSDPISGLYKNKSRNPICFCYETALFFFFKIQTLPQAQSAIHESTTPQPPGSVVSERMPWCGHVQAWPCHGCRGCHGCHSDAEV